MEEQLFDPIRGKLVTKTPEEVVRQAFIYYLIEKKGFPKAAISVEKALDQLPFVSEPAPSRRVDILCLNLKLGTPLLLVECKAGAISRSMMQQVHGYNTFIKAPFVVLVGVKSLFFSYFNSKKGEHEYTESLPDYAQLTTWTP